MSPLDAVFIAVWMSSKVFPLTVVFNISLFSSSFKLTLVSLIELSVVKILSLSWLISLLIL